MANNTTNKHQWIVLDGDIDAGKADCSRQHPRPPLTVAGGLVGCSTVSCFSNCCA
jgi:hypothetical protein